MKPDKIHSLIEELDENDPPENFVRIKTIGSSRPSQAATSRHKQPRQRIVVKKKSAVEEEFIHSQDDSTQAFRFTYQAARFEQGWLLETLGYFYEQHWISDVLRKIKVGKEASVYLCRSGTQVDIPLVAAKVYRPRMLRNLKNDQLYREGRPTLNEDGLVIRDLGMLKAQHKRSMYGEEIREQSWIAHEFFTLRMLSGAGGDVPQPYERSPRAILMDYIGDETLPAPLLGEVNLGKEEAARLFECILRNLHLLLSSGRIHGDLSAYNILYWNGAITLIDFPQVVPVKANRNAFAIFERDVTRLCEYFIDQGLSLQPRQIAADLWKAHGLRVKPDVDPRLLDADDPRDRLLWKDE